MKLGSGQSLINKQNANALAWNSSAGIKKLITSGKTQAPVALPAALKQGKLLDLVATMTELYYAFWQGVESTRHVYFLCVGVKQVAILARDGVSGITAVPPYGPQYVPIPQPPGSCKNVLNELVTPKNSGYGNGVTEYAVAYLDLSAGPYELAFPEIPSNIYWLVVIYNYYGEVIRTFGTRGGTKTEKYALVPPGFKQTSAFTAKYPASRQVELGGVDGILISRILDNVDYAVNYTITPINGKTITSTYWWGVDPSVFNVYNKYDPLYFWKVAALVNARNPRVGLTSAQKAALKTIGFIDDRGLVSSATSFEQAQNYWYVTSWNSQKGKEFAKEGAFFKGFWIANVVEDAVYILQFIDSTATPLNGGNLYNITFPGSAMPPTNGAFWSVQVMRLDEINLSNILSPLKTRSTTFCGYVYGDKISSASSLVKNPDGGVTIMLTAAPKPNNYTAANWLEAPAAVPLYLVLRVYNPHYPQVLSYSPPRVQRMD